VFGLASERADSEWEEIGDWGLEIKSKTKSKLDSLSVALALFRMSRNGFLFVALRTHFIEQPWNSCDSLSIVILSVAKNLQFGTGDSSLRSE
jgi:hypothetical protein